MKKILQFTIAILSVTALVAQKTSDISVTNTISDYDPSANAYYVQSDGLFGGVYTNGQAGVTSILQGGTFWELQTYDSSFSASSGRNFLITLNPAVNQASCSGCTAVTTPPSIFSQGWGTYLEPVRFIDLATGGCPMQTIKPGSPLGCSVHVKFGPAVASGGKHGGTAWYGLQMFGPNSCRMCVGAPETQQLQISCNAQDASGNCNDWSIDSIPPTSQNGGVPTNKVIARLVYGTDGSEIANLGDFYLTFHIHVTNP